MVHGRYMSARGAPAIHTPHEWTVGAKSSEGKHPAAISLRYSGSLDRSSVTAARKNVKQGGERKMPRPCGVEAHALDLDKEREQPGDKPLASGCHALVAWKAHAPCLDQEREPPGDKPLASVATRRGSDVSSEARRSQSWRTPLSGCCVTASHASSWSN